MSILSSTGKIYIVLKPVSGRFGIPRLMSELSSKRLKVPWDGREEITVVTFNTRRSLCSVLHVDSRGTDHTRRMLEHGTFDVFLEDGLLPAALTREQLEKLLDTGSAGENFTGLLRLGEKELPRQDK